MIQVKNLTEGSRKKCVKIIAGVFHNIYTYFTDSVMHFEESVKIFLINHSLDSWDQEMCFNCNMHGIVTHMRLPFFKIFLNFVTQFCPNFQIFCPFCPFSEKSHTCHFFLEQALICIWILYTAFQKKKLLKT